MPLLAQGLRQGAAKGGRVSRAERPGKPAPHCSKLVSLGPKRVSVLGAGIVVEMTGFNDQTLGFEGEQSLKCRRVFRYVKAQVAQAPRIAQPGVQAGGSPRLGQARQPFELVQLRRFINDKV